MAWDEKAKFRVAATGTPVENRLTVYRLIASDTVEERVLELRLLMPKVMAAPGGAAVYDPKESTTDRCHD